MQYRLLGKIALFWEAFSGKRFVCCALIVLYSIDSTVGQSIASISDLGGIFTSLPCYIYITKYGDLLTMFKFLWLCNYYDIHRRYTMLIGCIKSTSLM